MPHRQQRKRGTEAAARTHCEDAPVQTEGYAARVRWVVRVRLEEGELASGVERVDEEHSAVGSVERYESVVWGKLKASPHDALHAGQGPSA